MTEAITNKDPFTDERLNALLTRVEQAEELDNWWDQDPSVSWDMEEGESMYATLAAIYREAGFESCYHGDGARFHYDVKLRSNESYRAVRKVIDSAGVGDEERLERLIDQKHVFAIEDFWYDEITTFLIEELGRQDKPRWKASVKVYQCGRSGGYANCRDLESSPRDFLKLGQFLARSHAYYNSAEYGEWIATEALEEYREEKMQELASPRIERIEA